MINTGTHELLGKMLLRFLVRLLGRLAMRPHWEAFVDRALNVDPFMKIQFLARKAVAYNHADVSAIFITPCATDPTVLIACFICRGAL